MKVITIEQLKELGGLYFENIIDGTNQYPYEVKKYSEEETVRWFLELQEQYAIYADFYAARVTKESLSEFAKYLSSQEWAMFLELVEKCRSYEAQEFVIFEPEKEELELLVKISYRGLLFSTFYIMNPAVTIWSNFDGEMVLFANDAAILQQVIR